MYVNYLQFLFIRDSFYLQSPFSPNIDIFSIISIFIFKFSIYLPLLLHHLSFLLVSHFFLNFFLFSKKFPIIPNHAILFITPPPPSHSPLFSLCYFFLPLHLIKVEVCQQTCHFHVQWKVSCPVHLALCSPIYTLHVYTRNLPHTHVYVYIYICIS